MTDSISAYILGKVPLKQELLDETEPRPAHDAHQPDPGRRAGDPRDRAAHRHRGAEPGPEEPARVLPQRAAAGDPQGARLRRRRGHRGRGVRAASWRRPTSRRRRARWPSARWRGWRACRRCRPRRRWCATTSTRCSTCPGSKRSRDRIDTRKVPREAGPRPLRAGQGQGPHRRVPGGLQADAQAAGLDPPAWSARPAWARPRLGRSMADALDRKFVRLSLGGVRDEAEIRGHRRTYIGAMPGRVHPVAAQGRDRNPVFLLDEIDKIGATSAAIRPRRCSRCSTPSRTASSATTISTWTSICREVLFICTANALHSIPAALSDRMETIRLSGLPRRTRR